MEGRRCGGVDSNLVDINADKSNYICVLTLNTLIRGVFGLVLLGTTGACVTPVGTQAPLSKETKAKCEEQCESIGLRLAAVAIMANTAGCVCQEAGDVSTSLESSSSVTAGMATLVLQQKEEEQRRQSQSYRSQTYRRSQSWGGGY